MKSCADTALAPTLYGETNKSFDVGALSDALPDLVLLVHRDGTLTGFMGGCSVPALRPTMSGIGESLDTLWSCTTADFIKRLCRRAITERGTVEAELRDQTLVYEARATAQSPDTAICVIRCPSEPIAEGRSADVHASTNKNWDRRGFLRRFKNSIAIAALKEQPLSVAIVQIDGINDIAKLIDANIAERVLAAATERIVGGDLAEEPLVFSYYMGQLSETVLMVVMNTNNRDEMESCITRICTGLRAPIPLGDAVFHLTPYAGIAILNRDATSPKLLLEHARTSALEARKSGVTAVCFFSDTLKLRSLSRLDVTRELRDAIDNREIRLRYVPRHDLSSGKLVAMAAYVKWIHPMRGEVAPVDFLGIAESTGLSNALSRSMLEILEEDFRTLQAGLDSQVRISFGGLRQHILNDAFGDEIARLLERGVFPPERLELRIAERAYISRESGFWKPLTNLGIQLVVDEVGRQLSSFDLLARTPLFGIQLERTWVFSMNDDPHARRICGSAIAAATALGLTPIATGVDTVLARQALIELGCVQGMGDCFDANHPLA